MAGLAISKTRTAIAHSISYPVTLHFAVPHGLACSFTLEHILDDFLPNVEDQEERDLLLEIKQLLASLNLENELKAYVKDFKELKDYKKEMYTPDRAGNYFRKIDDIDLFLY
jgi:alcohol dehydrogenase